MGNEKYYKIKFKPAEFRRKKFTTYIEFPFYGNKIKETSSLIRKNGKWFDKKNK